MATAGMVGRLLQERIFSSSSGFIVLTRRFWFLRVIARCAAPVAAYAQRSAV
jgi:hypothetical protein